MWMNRAVSLFLFLLLVLGGGLAIGFLTAPGGWYAGLHKPAVNPPPWLFGPVWTLVYVLIAIAGWRIWHSERTGLAMQMWWAQLALNFLWSPVFFGAHQIGLALFIIVILLAVILGFIAKAWRSDRAAAWLFVPYAAWVAFASLLNGLIWMMN
jgi:tryptophan-rich sensory protein